jgi:PAS domain S-box-containing protein/putative nucleotidyltransferase with HDIG domain
MEKTKILVVEDESIVARDIHNMLLGLGYEVTGVISSAQESVEKAEETSPHLVLMDIMLNGELTGVDAADMIHSQYNIPIVYLTAYADENTLQRAKETEPFGYLLKPFEERELQTTIEIALYKFKMEMMLKNRERWLTTMLRSIGDAVIATNLEGNITFMNPSAESLSGWEQSDALDKSLDKVIKITDSVTKKSHPLDINKLLKDGTLEFPTNAVINSKKGSKTPIIHSAAPIKEERGFVTGAVIALTDVTLQKKAEEELKESWETLKSAMEGTVQAMAFTIETRDPYTAGHQRRVTKLAGLIAKEMGLSKDQIEGVEMAGNLHDIGKIYVPSEILNKPGKISDLEFNIIKTHPQVGYDILKSIKFPWPIAEIVFQHHERLDGSGYPSGLKGDQIHLEAKILAVADVIEAMATHRPYRPALTIEEALDEIKKHRGSRYEPKVVDAALSFFEKNKFDFSE